MSVFALVLSLAPTAAYAGSGGEAGELPTVTGMVGLYPVRDSSCAAIWLEIPEDQALAGIMWYNNDETVVFPAILLESGTPGSPVDLEDCQLVAENVQGGQSSWSEVDFAFSVGSISGGLYVLLRFPAGSEYHAEGAGGGAAVGYSAVGDGCPGWISAEGDDWVAFTDDFGLAVHPIFVPRSEATLIMQGAPSGSAGPISVVAVTGLERAFPNPFNATTRISFSLAREGPVKLDVFDLRGMRVTRLAHGVFTAGRHDIAWSGRDGSGRVVASGLYFMRLEADDRTFTERVVLVK